MFADNNRDYKSQTKGSRLPSLNALRCFEAAAALESFSKAGERLHMTHGAVSRAVRLLEDELGMKLFERRHARVFLTDAGRTLASAVADGFSRIAGAWQQLREQGITRTVTLSCEPTLLMRWLIPRLPDFQQRFPDVELHLVAGGGPVTLGQSIDLAIRRNDFPRPASWEQYPLFREAIGPVCQSTQVERFFDLTRPSAPSLRTDSILLHSRTRPEAWRDWAKLTKTAFVARKGQSYDHFYFSLQAALAGLGVAIGPWHLVRNDIERGVLAAPCGFREDGSLYVLLSPAKLETPSSETFLLDWLREQGTTSLL